jgi:DNA invertase Pin-like site-specific DNA recombinase
MIAAIYARKSTDQGAVADEAKSVRRQIHRRSRPIARRAGADMPDAHVYVDDRISGAEFANRPGFVRLMNTLKPHPPFQALIVSEESRLGREQIEVFGPENRSPISGAIGPDDPSAAKPQPKR